MKKKTVMVIDDEEVILKLISDLLMNEGYESFSKKKRKRNPHGT